MNSEFALTDCWTASALGVGNAASEKSLLDDCAPGMKEISGDIPGRSIWFGGVEGELPQISDPKWNVRTVRLLKLALENMPSLKRLVERYGAKRVGIVIGASNTGIDEAENYIDGWFDGKLSDNFDFSMLELGSPSIWLKRELGVEGPAYTVSTACSSATKAFGAARRLIAQGICDAVVTGGVDGRCRFAMNGFHALGALSQGRCRPLSPDRDGINLGEAVALFTLEKVFPDSSAVRLAGIGESSDAYHATAPDPEGRGAEAAMRQALADAHIEPSELEYVNLHGTGTIANDEMEVKAVERVFGGSVRYESTKRLTGHCLGAAGAVEAAICWLHIRSGRVRSALSNSFAFGGANGSIILAS